MGIAPRLEIRQSQTLKLTPQLMQSIKLMQLSHLDLASFIDNELMNNPLLEREEQQQPIADSGEPEPAATSGEEREIFNGGEPIDNAVSAAGELDADSASLFPEQVGQDSISQSTRSWEENRSGVPAGERAEIDRYVPANMTLTDHLAAQIRLLLRHPEDLVIAGALVENLNEAGYLASPLEHIAERLGTEYGNVEAVQQKLLGCDPIGIFARTVPECLAVQLRELDRLDPMMEALLSNLDLVAAHKFAEIMRIVECDQDDLAEMLDEIKRLNPRPGAGFVEEPAQSVIADVFVRATNDGGWNIELNSDVLPRVLVNRHYSARVTNKARKGEEKNYVAECLQSANWLIRSLDQRAQTVLKVAREIVRMQDSFLLHGISWLKPMTLKMVAQATGMHESTVSRATANKYISTPRGVFEMRYFFTSAISSVSGTGDHSAESVKHEIKKLIDAEDPGKILSDDKIAAILNENQQMGIARRTVAKYREAMDIPSSVLRRRQKRGLAFKSDAKRLEAEKL